jgi:hypothetical protein
MYQGALPLGLLQREVHSMHLQLFAPQEEMLS